MEIILTLFPTRGGRRGRARVKLHSQPFLNILESTKDISLIFFDVLLILFRNILFSFSGLIMPISASTDFLSYLKQRFFHIFEPEETDLMNTLHSQFYALFWIKLLLICTLYLNRSLAYRGSCFSAKIRISTLRNAFSIYGLVLFGFS